MATTAHGAVMVPWSVWTSTWPRLSVTPRDPNALDDVAAPVGDLGGEIVQEGDRIELGLVGQPDGADGGERQPGVVALGVEAEAVEQGDLAVEVTARRFVDCVGQRRLGLPGALDVALDAVLVDPVEPVSVGGHVRLGDLAATGRAMFWVARSCSTETLAELEPVAPPAMTPMSTTTTSTPRRASSTAVASPAMPAPTTTQSAVAGSSRSANRAWAPPRRSNQSELDWSGRAVGEGAASVGAEVVRGIRGSLVRRALRPAGSERAQGIPAPAARQNR